MSILKRFLLAVLLTFCVQAVAAPGDQAVGMVLDLQGTGRVADKDVVTRLQLLAYLKPQTRIMLDAGSKVSLSLYATRSTYQLAGPAVVDIRKDGLTVIEGAKPVVKSMSEKLVAAAEKTTLTAGAYRMRSLAPRIVVAVPENGSVLLGSRVAFRWVATDATGFEISLLDQDEKLIASAKPDETSWTLPESVILSPGNTYYWTVSGKSKTDGKRHSATGEFSLASKEEAAAIAELKPAETAPIEEWMLYMATLQGRRYTQEARSAWEFIRRQRPDLHNMQEPVR